MITQDEIEILALILQRAGVNRIEAAWVNALLGKLLALAQDRHETVGPQQAIENSPDEKNLSWPGEDLG